MFALLRSSTSVSFLCELPDWKFTNHRIAIHLASLRLAINSRTKKHHDEQYSEIDGLRIDEDKLQILGNLGAATNGFCCSNARRPSAL